MADKDSVEELIQRHQVLVFSKSWCPYCSQAKKTLDSLYAHYTTIELDKNSNGIALQKVLEKITGQSSVPNIFIGQRHIGGNSDLQEIFRNGELQARLLKVGAVA